MNQPEQFNAAHHPSNVESVKRIPIEEFTLDFFKDWVVTQHKPVVITGFKGHLSKDIWFAEYLENNYGNSLISVSEEFQKFKFKFFKKFRFDIWNLIEKIRASSLL